jgi:hypothetical protein
MKYNIENLSPNQRNSEINESEAAQSKESGRLSLR